MGSIRVLIYRLALLALTACGAVPEGEEPNHRNEEPQTAAIRVDSELPFSRHGGYGKETKRCSFIVCTVGRDVSNFSFSAKGRLRILRIWAGRVIDGLEVVWQDENAPFGLVPSAHAGGYGGRFTEWLLDPDEVILKVRGRSGDLVDSLTFFTNKRVRVFGGTGGFDFSDDAGQLGREIHGFKLIAGKKIDNIQMLSYLP